MNKQKTYKLKFKCWNCNEIWEQDIPKGCLVEHSYGADETVIFSSDEQYWEEVICPNCKTKKEVRKYFIDDQYYNTRKNNNKERTGKIEESD